jgi:dTDP-4-amino-4,6-dideoxygalactose transaminase
MPGKPRIPILDLTPEIDFLWDDLNAAFQRVIRSGVFIGGPEVEAFENEVAEYLGVKHAIGVNSGTDALVIALRALNIGPGDEVITTPFSFFATAESIANVGAQPVFVDIDPRTFNIDPNLIPAAITPRTKAIMPVHLYGLACDMTNIMSIARERKLIVIEDCAQSFGATHTGKQTGTFGHAGAFSFFPTKPLGGFGDGGMITTNDPNTALLAKKLRSHGGLIKYQNEMLGYNSRLDALQAALIRVKLPHVTSVIRHRQAVARRYLTELDGIPGVTFPVVSDAHALHQFTLRVKGCRDEVRQRLIERGVETMVYYPTPTNALPERITHGWSISLTPEASLASAEVLSLPLPSRHKSPLACKFEEVAQIIKECLMDTLS